MSDERESCVCGNHANLVKDPERGWKVVCCACGRQSDTYTKKEFAVKCWNSVMKAMKEAER